MKLLVCIAFHYVAERLKYLDAVLSIRKTYNCEVDIIVDTNTNFKLDLMFSGVKFICHDNLKHPFHLTSIHRQHFKNNIDNYDYFMYVEDDILVPYNNFRNYIENFTILWPIYVPSFIRIEEADGVQYVSDVVKQQTLQIIEVNGNQFAHLNFPNDYHGFWIMPRKELKESMTADFTKLSDNREGNAMFAGWGLGKTTLVELKNNLISPACYSYHLPNNYALSKESPQAKFKPNEIFL